uniref:Uncharacterized protein n=1 Tax=Phlebotomus papatasi TaxID=29031 RepID=A0A1B0D2K4_PHLPP
GAGKISDSYLSFGSASIFLPLTVVPLGAKRVLDVEDLFLKFDKKLRNGVKEQFETMWEDSNISQCLSALECLREEAPDKSAVQWRPSGKTPREQLIPYIVKTLQKKCSYLDRQNIYQEKLFDEYVPRVMEIREKIGQIVTTRKIHLELMEVHRKQLEAEKDRNSLFDEGEKILDLIRE